MNKKPEEQKNKEDNQAPSRDREAKGDLGEISAEGKVLPKKDKEEKPYLATGSPGGSHIITTTLQILLNVIDHDMNLASATAAPRVHHQWLPDEVRVERGLSPDTVGLLKKLGHTVTVQDTMGGAQSILKNSQGFWGASDPRKPDSLAAGY